VPGRIRLEPYDPGWASRFEAERDLVEQLLAPWLVGRVEHVGSTAVPGLEAKPILDMIAPVRSLPEASAAEQPLLSAGYGKGVHRPAEAHYFFKPAVERWWQHATTSVRVM
jgi:GrpB-like predicted nucleotidyltransferase (UPF0157 family)